MISDKDRAEAEALVAAAPPIHPAVLERLDTAIGGQIRDEMRALAQCATPDLPASL
jgi:hypothetical protein